MNESIADANLVKELVSSQYVTKEARNKIKKRYNTHLLKAVASGDSFLVERCIGWGASPNATCQLGKLSACHIASSLGHAEVLEILLKQGAEPKRKDEKGRQAIHLAALNGHLGCMQVLYAALPQTVTVKVEEYGDYVQDDEWDSFTHIHSQLYEIITDKIREGATPAQIAYERKNDECVLFLFSVGASLTTEEMQSTEGLIKQEKVEERAVLFFQKSVPALLTPQGDNDIPDAEVHPLRKSRSIDLGEKLRSEREPELDVPEEVRAWDGPSLLQCAEEKLLMPLRQLLLTSDFIDERDNENRTPIHVAVSNGWKEGVQLLIEAGSDITCRTKNLDTPLHLAAQKGYAEILEQLISVKDSKKVIYFPNREKNTPLFLAVMNNHLDCVKILCDNGTNLDYTVSKDSVLHVAARLNYLEILKYFMEKGNLAPLLLSHTEVSPDRGCTPLHIAAKRGHDGIIKALLKYSKEILEVPDSDGNTSLHLAALEGHTSSSKILLDNGASLAAESNCIRASDMLGPTFLNEVFDESVRRDGEEVSLDFHLLTPGGDQLSVVSSIKDDYVHALVESYVFLKWRQLKNFLVLALLAHTALAVVMTHFFLEKRAFTFFPVTLAVSSLISICIFDEIANVRHSLGRGESGILSVGYLGMFLLNWHHEHSSVWLGAYLTVQLAWLNILLLTPSLTYGHYGIVFGGASIKAVKALVISLMGLIAAKVHMMPAYGSMKLNSAVTAFIMILAVLSLRGSKDKAATVNKKQKRVLRLLEKFRVHNVFRPLQQHRFLKTDTRALPIHIHDLLI